MCLEHTIKMLNKNKVKVLEKLIENINLDLTLLDMSKALDQKYSQTYNSVQSLSKKGLINIKKIGKSKVVKLDFLAYHPEYAMIEMERLSKIIKHKNIFALFTKILNINKQFVCTLYGSYADAIEQAEELLQLSKKNRRIY